jgi:hypothetical protein
MPLILLPVFCSAGSCGTGLRQQRSTFIYDKTFMIAVGVALLLLLIWTEGFKASLDEAPTLAKFQYEMPNLGWLRRYYLRRNDLIEAYWRVYNYEVKKTRSRCTCSSTCPRCIGATPRRCRSSPRG